MTGSCCAFAIGRGVTKGEKARLLNTGSEKLEFVELTYSFVLTNCIVVKGPFGM